MSIGLWGICFKKTIHHFGVLIALALLSGCIQGSNFHITQDALPALYVTISSPTKTVSQGTTGYKIKGSCSPAKSVVLIQSEDLLPQSFTCSCGDDLTYSCGQLGFPGTGPGGSTPSFKVSLTDSAEREVQKTQSVSIVTPSVNLIPPAVIVSGTSFALTGMCQSDQSTISVDVGNDSTSTTGVSGDPASCTCENGALSCSALTVDYSSYASEDLTFQTTLNDPAGASTTDTDTNATKVLYLDLNTSASINDNQVLDVTGICAPNGATISITAPSGFTPATQTCACAGNNLNACTDLTESSATINSSLTFEASISQSSKTQNVTKTLTVINSAPVARSTDSGVGNAYDTSQLGGLSFTRYGENNPAGNQVSHDELMDFVDDPIGNADGIRADGSTAQSSYGFGGTSTPGWQQSGAVDKYADVNGEITPRSGTDFFGDTYRGYFVPPSNGIYQFQNTVTPDNSVRIMMSSNECPHKAIAIMSGDILNADGAVKSISTWINGNGGNYPSGNTYYHNTAVFFPAGSGDADYGNGTVYLLASKIYYLEVRYGEGGGGNAFAFGFDRWNFGGGAHDGVTNLKANRMLPYSGSDKYVPRQACQGAFNAADMFTDSDNDTLTYTAKLVNSDGSAISGSGADITTIGLSINTSTGVTSGTLNGSFTTQKIVFGATDASGSNSTVYTNPLSIIQ